MKRFHERMAHLVLAFVILLGSNGLVLNAHYCSGKVLSKAIFLKATPCSHAEVAKKPCPMHRAASGTSNDTQKKNCCSDKSEYIHSEDVQIASSQNAPNDQAPVFVASLPASAVISTPVIDDKTIHFLNFKPPLIVYDISLVLETFLC